MSLQPLRIEDAAQATRSRRTASWIVDEVVTALIIVLGVVPVLSLADSMPSVGSGTWALVALCIALVLPVLYGLLCFNGRSIGCLVAGTAFFSMATGRRAHNARMMWVMGHRWLWPIIAIVFLMSLFSADTTPSGDRLHKQLKVRGVELSRGRPLLPGQGNSGAAPQYGVWPQQAQGQRQQYAPQPTQQPPYPPHQHYAQPQYQQPVAPPPTQYPQQAPQQGAWYQPGYPPQSPSSNPPQEYPGDGQKP